MVSTSLCRVDGVKGGSGLAQHVNKYLVKGADSLYLYFIFNTPFGTNLEYDEKQIYFHNVGNFAFAKHNKYKLKLCWVSEGEGPFRYFGNIRFDIENICGFCIFHVLLLHNIS